MTGSRASRHEVQNIFGRENFQSEYKVNKPAFKPSACTRDLLGGLGFSIKDYLVCLKGHCHTKTKAGAFSGLAMLKVD